MMTGSARLRDADAALVIAVLAGLLILAPPLDRLHGLSIDLLTALRWRVFGNMHEPQASPAVVVALDEETYRTPPFVGTPAITWTPETSINRKLRSTTVSSATSLPVAATA